MVTNFALGNECRISGILVVWFGDLKSGRARLRKTSFLENCISASAKRVVCI